MVLNPLNSSNLEQLALKGLDSLLIVQLLQLTYDKCPLFVQVPLNLTGVRAVRPLLLTPASYSQIEQTLLKLNLPSQPPLPQQQPVPAASVQGS